MKLDPRAVKTLERLLEQELSSYSEYLALLAQEQVSVVGLKAEQVSVLSQRRSELVIRIGEIRDKRLALVAELSGNQEQKLSELIRVACTPADAKRLDKLISQIKAILKIVESKSREFNQVLNFSLGLVNGEISLLWSASQSITRVYNAFGTVNEAVQPSAPRNGSLLGEA
jgi:hypothetical protein